MHNDKNPKHTKPKSPYCQDLPYLIITTILFLAILIFAIINYSPQKLYQLSMPRNSMGSICSTNNTGPYTQIIGPYINNRQCVKMCEQQAQPNDWLGGVCISDRIQYILKQKGQYQRYIQPKFNTLNRFQILGLCIAITLGIGFVLALMLELSGCCCESKVISNIIVGLSIVVGSVVLYFLYFGIGFIVWVVLCVVFVLYFVYVLVWKILRRNNSLHNVYEDAQHIQGGHNKNIQTFKQTIIIRLILALIVSIICIGFACLLIFQYLAFISQSPYYSWSPPALYAQVNGITYKQIFVLVQAIYLISFTMCLYQYLVESLHASKLGLKRSLYSMVCYHLGSICKLAIIRILFIVPIFMLTLIKPLQNQKFADPSHCLCGYLLNLARKYSLPIFAYQSVIKQPLNLGQAAKRLHYQTHINHYQFSQGYVQKMAMLTIFASAAVGFVLIWENKLGLSVSLLTLGLAGILSIWVGNSFVSAWIHAKEGNDVRRICQNNRVEQVI